MSLYNFPNKKYEISSPELFAIQELIEINKKKFSERLWDSSDDKLILGKVIMIIERLKDE